MTKQTKERGLFYAHHIHFSSMNAPDGLPRIVIVDHYDSYTRNLIPLIASCFDPPPDPELLARRVTVIPHTLPVLSPLAFRERLLTHVDALILSPGPVSYTHLRAHET